MLEIPITDPSEMAIMLQMKLWVQIIDALIVRGTHLISCISKLP